MESSLQDRVILITGASAGIGRATALACARGGAQVILLGRTIPRLEQVYDEIEAMGRGSAAIYPLNLEGATPHDYGELAATLEREYGRLDTLLHNAALLGALSPVQSLDPELWYRTLQVNLNAPFLLSQACLELLTRSEAGSVVFMSDAVGRKGRAYWGGYGVSKGGLEIFSQILADELEVNTRVRVNTYDPGPVRTFLRELAYPGEDPSTLTTPEEIAADLVKLLGADRPDVTGRQFSYPLSL